MIFWNQKWAWWFTAIMFLLNNTVGPHVHTLPALSTLVHMSVDLTETNSPLVHPRAARPRRCKVSQHHDCRRRQYRLPNRQLLGHHVHSLLDLFAAPNFRGAFEARRRLRRVHVHLRATSHHLRRNRAAPSRLRSPVLLHHSCW